jgi:hypothetical protein
MSTLLAEMRYCLGGVCRIIENCKLSAVMEILWKTDLGPHTAGHGLHLCIFYLAGQFTAKS